MLGIMYYWRVKVANSRPYMICFRSVRLTYKARWRWPVREAQRYRDIMNNFMEYYLRGKKAKEVGEERCPVYSRMEHNNYWCAGYDGVIFSDIETEKNLNAELSYSRIGVKYN